MGSDEPRAIHLGQAKDLDVEQTLDVMTHALYQSHVRAAERRTELKVSSSTYWPTAPFAISLDEIRALVALTERAPLPDELQPLVREFRAVLEAGEASWPT